MPDIKYCYPNTNVLKNKLNIIDKKWTKSNNSIQHKN